MLLSCDCLCGVHGVCGCLWCVVRGVFGVCDVTCVLLCVVCAAPAQPVALLHWRNNTTTSNDDIRARLHLPLFPWKSALPHEALVLVFVVERPTSVARARARVCVARAICGGLCCARCVCGVCVRGCEWRVPHLQAQSPSRMILGPCTVPSSLGRWHSFLKHSLLSA